MADQQRLEVAAQEAGAAEMIHDLPNGWDTILSRMFEGGSELSPGQWQRVALARALFSPAEMVILDEPTASLDAKQEYDLLQRFERLTRGKTTVLISHRLSSARLVDRILFFEKGEVVEEGSHERLLEVNGRYAAMFRRQAANYTEKGEAFSATLFPV
jgi:ATP-binding cassette subfamily B protein